MNEEELRNILFLGEGQSVEFKMNCRADFIGRLACAFLNTGGGYVVYGISDDGKVVGIDKKGRISDLERKLNQRLSPKALISVDDQDIEGKRVLVIETPSGKDIPYAYQNDIYIRKGTSIHKADIETIRDMVMRWQIEPERWERRFSNTDLETDRDVNEIRSLVRAVNKTGRIQFRN